MSKLLLPAAISWNRWVASFPEAHVLQTWQWGDVKRRYGWKPYYMLWSGRREPGQVFHKVEDVPDMAADPQAVALALQRSVSIRGIATRLNVLYLPKGPLLSEWGNSSLRKRVLEDLRGLGRQLGAIFIKIDPDVCLGTGVPGKPEAAEALQGSQVVGTLLVSGWRYSAEQVQFRNTVVIDLNGPEDALLMRMKQKTRYNIRLAERKGVQVRLGGADDLELLYRMYAETSVRDGFVIRDERYYQDLWRTFLPHQDNSPSSHQPIAYPLIAEVSGEPVAAILVFVFGGKAWYLFGMSRDLHREAMPNHLLQWEGMRLAKAAGCHSYDLWGAPDNFREGDPLWGVFRFKEGLGGEVIRHIGAWDLPLRPFYYKLYTEFLPRFLDVLRRRGKARTERTVAL